MATIKIKNESLPTRCEICHQQDLFDPSTNHCQRCSGITIADTQSTDQHNPHQARRPLTYFQLREFNGREISAITLSVSIAALLGCGFNWLIHRVDLEPFFYINYDFYQFLPTWRYCLLLSLLFQIGLWGSYGLSRAGRLINSSGHRLRDRWLSIGLIQLAFICIPFTFHLGYPGAIVSPFIPAAALILSLRLITGRWYEEMISGLLITSTFSIVLFAFSVLAFDIYYPMLGALFNFCAMCWLIEREQVAVERITPAEREEFLHRPTPAYRAYRDYRSDEPGTSWF